MQFFGTLVKGIAFITLLTSLDGCSSNGSPSVNSLSAADVRLTELSWKSVRKARSPNATFAEIYAFQAGIDGQHPWGSGLSYANGVFYGTTYGKFNNFNNTNCGTVFSLKPNAAFTSFTETVLHAFTGAYDDGCQPEGGVIVVGSTLFTVRPLLVAL